MTSANLFTPIYIYRFVYGDWGNATVHGIRFSGLQLTAHQEKMICQHESPSLFSNPPMAA